MFTGESPEQVWEDLLQRESALEKEKRQFAEAMNKENELDAEKWRAAKGFGVGLLGVAVLVGCDGLDYLTTKYIGPDGGIFSIAGVIIALGALSYAYYMVRTVKKEE
jgi:hypothetical protein